MEGRTAEPARSVMARVIWESSRHWIPTDLNQPQPVFYSSASLDMRVTARLGSTNIEIDGPDLPSPTSMASSPQLEGYTYDPNTLPPAFGHGVKKYWAFEEGYVNLNHGEFCDSNAAFTRMLPRESFSRRIMTDRNHQAHMALCHSLYSRNAPSFLL